jgi:hypothetical protein
VRSVAHLDTHIDHCRAGLHFTSTTAPAALASRGGRGGGGDALPARSLRRRRPRVGQRPPTERLDTQAKACTPVTAAPTSTTRRWRGRAAGARGRNDDRLDDHLAGVEAHHAFVRPVEAPPERGAGQLQQDDARCLINARLMSRRSQSDCGAAEAAELHEPRTSACVRRRPPPPATERSRGRRRM